MTTVRTDSLRGTALRYSKRLVPLRIFSAYSGLMDNKTRMDASALDDDLEARIGQRGEARVGVRVDHVVVDEIGAGQPLLERRVVGEPDQRRVLAVRPEPAQLLLGEHAVGRAVLEQLVHVGERADVAHLFDGADGRGHRAVVRGPLAVARAVD